VHPVFALIAVGLVGRMSLRIWSEPRSVGERRLVLAAASTDGLSPRG